MELEFHGMLEGEPKKLSDKLNIHLSSFVVTYTKLEGFHWTVEGPRFLAIHSLFNDLYEEIDSFIDKIAERIRQLECKPFYTLAQYIEASYINETNPNKDYSCNEMIEIILEDFKTLVGNLRVDIYKINEGEIKDLITQSILLSFCEYLEKQIWFLKSLSK